MIAVKLTKKKTDKEEFGLGADRKIPVENIDAIVNIKELDDDKFIRYSKKVGAYYVSIIENIAGKSELNEDVLGGLPDGLKDKMREYIQSISKNKELMHLRFELKDNAAKELITELIEKKGLKKELLESEAKKYELEEASRGIFVMYMDKDLFSLIHGEKTAVATINKKGISFISMPSECKAEKNCDLLFAENLLHEFHHMVWSFLVKEGKIICDEKNEGIKFCYEYLQDEIVAKIASGGGMACYTSLPFIDKKSPEDFRANYLGREEEIKVYLTQLNQVMCDELMPFMQKIGVNKQDLIYPIMESSNFEDLKANLRKFKKALEVKSAEKEKNESLGENHN